MNDKDSEFSKAEFYEDLFDGDEYDSEHYVWSACLYNCDLLYMTAIAHVLNLNIPEDSCDVEIFGM